MRPYTLSRKKSRLSLTLQSKFYLLFPCSRLSKIVKTWCHGRFLGGDGRTRTGGILLAKQALYQLSYAPRWGLVGLTGIEPVTSSLSGTRSNQLSYKPMSPGRGAEHSM